jgi:hypothetical protein
MSLDTSSPDRWDWLAAGVFALAFAILFQAGVPLRGSFGARVTADEPFYLLTVESLRTDRDLDLTNQYERMAYARFWDGSEPLWHQSSPGPDGRLLSPHNVGLPVLLLPAYSIGGLETTKGFLATIGGVTVGFAYLLTRRLVRSRTTAAAATALVAVSAPWFIYASQIYPEMPAALLVCLTLWMLLAPRPGAWQGACVALLLAGAMWLGSKYAPIAAALFLLALVRLPRPGAILLVAVSAGLASHYLWFHHVTFGGATPYTVNRLYSGYDTVQLVQLHWGFIDRVYRFLGLWVDQEFGLVRWAPILLLVLPGASFLVRRKPRAGTILLSVIAVQLFVAVFLAITMRGWWFPGRMLIVVLPALVPLVAAALQEMRNWVAFGVVALLIMGTVNATLSLWLAARAGIVALAVNPFAAHGAWLDLSARAFPLFTEYGPATLGLSICWLALAAVLLLWPVRSRVTSIRQAEIQAAPATT